MDSECAFEAIVRECMDFSQGFVPPLPPCCFLHQISQICVNPNQVQVELELARKQGILRQIMTPLGILLFREDDYRSLAVQKNHEQFATLVLQQCTNLSISKAELLSLVGEKEFQQVLKDGFVLYHAKSTPNQAMLQFSVPGLALFLKQIERGRVELSKTLKLHPRGLARRKITMKKSTGLSVEFHLKDMLGINLVEAKATTMEDGSLFFLLS